MYDYILFDLDGTLTDSEEGIVKAVAYALEKFGIHCEDREILKKFIGPPLRESFRKYFGLDEKDGWQGVLYYREYYNVTGIYENRVYDGVREMLTALKQQGKKLGIATSKPSETALDVLNHFGLSGYFDFYMTATMDGTRGKKAMVLDYGIRQMYLSELNQGGNYDAIEVSKSEGLAKQLSEDPDFVAFKKKILMVGDRDQDVDGAKANGIDVCGVLYGFGDRAELTGAGADYIAETPKDILQFV